MHDINDYDRFVNKRAALTAEMLRDANAAKGHDDRGLEAIAAALNAARTATGGSEHVSRWADAAWQLALDMAGKTGGVHWLQPPSTKRKRRSGRKRTLRSPPTCGHSSMPNARRRQPTAR